MTTIYHLPNELISYEILTYLTETEMATFMQISKRMHKAGQEAKTKYDIQDTATNENRMKKGTYAEISHLVAKRNDLTQQIKNIGKLSSPNKRQKLAAAGSAFAGTVPIVCSAMGLVSPAIGLGLAGVSIFCCHRYSKKVQLEKETQHKNLNDELNKLPNPFNK